jgi:hypothetical protein
MENKELLKQKATEAARLTRTGIRSIRFAPRILAYPDQRAKREAELRKEYSEVRETLNEKGVNLPELRVSRVVPNWNFATYVFAELEAYDALSELNCIVLMGRH